MNFRKLQSKNDQVTPVENFFGTDNKKTGDVTFLGIPLSTTEVTFGVEFFPSFLRKATAKYAHVKKFFQEGLYSELLTHPSPLVLAKGVSISDAGDLVIEGKRATDIVADLSAFWDHTLSEKSKPIFVGGDHAITYLILKSLKSVQPKAFADITLLHFDAHNDFLNQNEIILHHASPIYNCVAELGIKKVRTFGARTLTDSRVLSGDDTAGLKLFLKHVELWNPMQVANAVSEFVSNEKPAASKKNKPKAYLTIDLDVLDSQEIGAGVSVSLEGGITWEQLYLMILKLRTEYDIIGCDVVEGRVFGFENPMLLKKTLLLLMLLLDVLKHPSARHLGE